MKVTLVWYCGSLIAVCTTSESTAYIKKNIMEIDSTNDVDSFVTEEVNTDSIIGWEDDVLGINEQDMAKFMESSVVNYVKS